MAKLNDNHMVMALRMRTVDIPDHIIEDLIGVRFPVIEPDAALDELVTETESLGLYDDDDTTQEEEIAVEA